ncbi:MAG: UDP-N-acetylglucosamine 1-carboxyvinyltransferase, partial [Firmicutes bacterium]|nr:UDP-N-acetylglucosamine 1-carboxyvinyltransferase [Bacillota bacterium]
MAKLIVKKSAPLSGEVTISGSKNAVLPIMAATLLTDDTCIIKDVPALRDVEVMCQLLESLGASVDGRFSDNVVEVKASGELKYEAPFELVKMMRASILVLGALLLRTGRALIHLPGGCAIGERPIELHLKGLRALGAEINEQSLTKGIVDAKADKLKGATIYLDFPSVGATEVIIMAASLAEGTTVLENAAQEPEIVDLANFLNKMGARIKGAGTGTIKIEGVEKLHGVSHHVIPDRIEAGTFMVGAAITKGRILIKNMLPDHLKAVIAKLNECGVVIELTDEGVIVDGSRNQIVSTDIKTLPYPGFPTDMQPEVAAVLGLAEGISIVNESIFENRFKYVDELNRMGANIKVEGNVAIITGVTSYNGARVSAPDLRAGAALIIAGLQADGYTFIDDIQYRLMEALVAYHKNLFVVGDPDQTIYTWRGANIRYLLDFDKKFEGTKTIMMNENYRSTPAIIDVANSLIKKNKNRMEKNLHSVTRKNFMVPLYSHWKKQEDEAENICKKLMNLHESGIKYSDCAILYRAHYVSRSLEDALSKNDIPYTMFSGISFFDREEVKDALSYLRMCIFKDDLSFRRIVNKPRRNIGKTRMEALEKKAEENQCTLFQALCDMADSKDEILKGT